jgi:hypothetical protein
MKRGPLQPVQAIQSGDPVGLGEGRIVEDRVAEILDRSAKGEDGLSDMDDLRRAVADRVDAQDLRRLGIEENLELPDLRPDHLPLGELGVLRLTHLVGHSLLRQLLLANGNRSDYGCEPAESASTARQMAKGRLSALAVVSPRPGPPVLFQSMQ